VTWRHPDKAPPDYSKVNATFFASRTKKHPIGSLEQIVQNLVKNWEIEQHNIPDHTQWQTMDIEKLKIYMNGKGPFHAADLAKHGPYNAMIGDRPELEYTNQNFESSEKAFVGAFQNTGFAWEVLEVFSGPPNVSFTWRHWGKYEGVYMGHEPTGKLIELFGHTVARVNSNLQIEQLELFFDPSLFLKELISGKKVSNL